MIASVIVLYNPNIDSLKRNIASFINYVDIILLIDNSSKKLIDNDLLNNEKIIYQFYGDNLGIAKALSDAAKIAISQGYNLLLTMDQDSYFDNANIDYYFSYLENHNEIGMICPNYLNICSENNVFEIKYAITSGCILNLNAYKKIKGFNEELFIDFVDFDLCYQLQEKGFKILQLSNVHLNHKLGDNLNKKVFGKKIIISNHSILRYYYIYRNYFYCSQNNKQRKIFFKDLKFRYCFIDIIKLLFFEKDRIKKIKMIKLGKQHAMKKKLGKYKGESI